MPEAITIKTKTMKILLTGASGAGKTTLAKHLAWKHDIPFISGSSKDLWPKYGIKTHLELIQACQQDSEFAQSFQYELLYHRNKQVEGLKSYVTDRTPMDNLLYYTLQVSHLVDTDSHRNYVKVCLDSMPKDDYHLFLLNVPTHNLEDDGMRVNNVFYQLFCENTLLYLLRIYLTQIENPNKFPFTVLKEWDWSTRLEIVDKQLKPKKWERIARKLLG